MTTSNSKLSDVSKVLYAELISKEKGAVLQAKISLKGGTGKGSVTLPPGLPSGNYQFRAYTSIMKNFGLENFFKKSICIINTQGTKDSIHISPENALNVSLIPEGGNLVNGIESKIAFKVTGADNKGIQFRGTIIKGKSDTILRFKPEKFGIGTFKFTPDINEKYRILIVSEDGRSIVAQLPEILESGYVMRAETDSPGKIRISVKSNGSASSRVYLVGHTHNAIRFADQQMLSDGSATFFVDMKNLLAGVTCFTLFDERRKPVGERLYFKFPNDNAEVVSHLNSDTFSRRQKVNLDISVKNGQKKSLASSLSVSVFYAPSNLNIRAADIVSYMLLTSELRGSVEDPESYFEEREARKDILVDNLMLAYGQIGFSTEKISHVPEYEGHLVQALIKDVNNKPASDVIAFLSIPGKRVQLFTAKSDSAGVVRFNTKDIYGRNEFILQLYPDNADKYKIDLLSPYFSSYTKADIPVFSPFTDSLEKGIWRANLNRVVRNIFWESKENRYIAPEIDSAAFFGKPEKTYLLDSYTRFATTEEVFREYIPEIWLQRKEGSLKLTLSDLGGVGLFNTEPLMLVDGVPVFQSSKILRYDPLKIRSIDVVGHRYYWGPTSFDGIVSFKTYQGNLDGFQLDPNDTVVDYEGMLEERKFYSPQYVTTEQVSSPLPDFRNLLFWSPDIVTDSSDGKTFIEFYTSDQKGTYIGSLQGVTDDGSFVNHVFTFNVK
ncbi:hypothetical protein F1649_17780 [Arcticibacter tournemirensis]|uniref:Carboxypeptidase regulatory-like domain-containing protein n=1 Tax=Arcticibacter tournemirensis TaxID=699437 RepID=A0A5M9GWY3_9SPHI|nr:hypothetical protein [Arcticibacter tournemirensis]KAA8478439.1 hypothetical protein F1649_17780 [Arcticibacter tournemirensis]